MRSTFARVLTTVSLGLLSCATYTQDLNRAEQHFQANEHERALALFRVLERDLDSLAHADRARYAYLRGMTDYRLGEAFHRDARYWLGHAQALETQVPGGLRPEWKEHLAKALADLNSKVFGTSDVDAGSATTSSDGGVMGEASL